MTLYIKDFIQGDTAISYDDGNKCLKEILKAVNNQEEVTLDFSGIDSIGQAFADEIFRVYVNAHPEITLTYRNANQSIKNMISHVN